MNLNELIATLETLQSGSPVYRLKGNGTKQMILPTPQNIRRIVERVNSGSSWEGIWHELSDEVRSDEI